MDPEKQQENQTQAGPKSKKWLYIVGGIILVLLVGKFALGGSGYSVNGTNVTPGSNGSATYSNSDGSVTVGTNKLPADWPSDAPTYANAQIQSAVSSNSQHGAAIVFITTDSIQTVIDFYKKALAANGWTVKQTVNTRVGILTATKDKRNLSVLIADSGDGKVSITLLLSASLN